MEIKSKENDIYIIKIIKKIKREGKSNIFSERLKSNLTKYILNFLEPKTKFNFAKTSIFILNNFIDNENLIFLDKIKLLHEEYPLLELNYDETDIKSKFDNLLELKTLFKFKDSEEEISKYESPEMRKNYLKIEKDRKSFIALGNCFNWSWKENKHHWIISKNNLNYFNYKFWYLIDVCWVHTLLVFRNIPKGNYKLFLNNKYNFKKFKGQLKLIISYGKHIIYFIDNWPSEYQINEFFVDKNKGENEIKEDFICVIKEENFIVEEKEYPGVEQEAEHEKYKKKDDEFYVEFWHNGGDSKKGWYFGGARLEEIKKGELEMAIKDEDERKKLTGLKYDTSPP